MRRGFTMIELIFVIVIIGVLAVLAIPRLAASKDDAKIATEMNNLARCIQDIGAKYIATGKEGSYKDIPACQWDKELHCFGIGSKSYYDGNITIKKRDEKYYPKDKYYEYKEWCPRAIEEAAKKGMKVGKEISFKGGKVKF